jgi:hypothetical protein
MAELNTKWRYCGLQVVRLENAFLRVDVLPEAGAKIYNFVHKGSGRNLLWHNPHIDPARHAFGACFDDNWSGGWDELLPNDLPGLDASGDPLPDHGEFWTQSTQWDVLSSSGDSSGDSISVRFTAHGRVSPVTFEKTLTLRDGESFCRIHYRLTNRGTKPYDYVWNVHPAMAVSTDTWLDVPAGDGFTDGWRTERFPAGGTFHWPHLPDRQGIVCDLRRVEPPESGIADQQYMPDVAEGWYAVTDRRLKVGFGMVFPTTLFPNVWLFRTFGGWRGLNTLILELSTGKSRDFDEARAKRECATLAPGGTQEAELLACAYDGVTGVSHIDASGRVTARPEA